MSNTLYTVQRIDKDDKLNGPTHSSDHAETTLCGQNIDHHWYILNNSFDGDTTCRRCLKIQRESRIGER
jgi:hypothetical protein